MLQVPQFSLFCKRHLLFRAPLPWPVAGWEIFRTAVRGAMSQMQVIVPLGVGPGMPFIVNSPAGSVQVTCPLHATAGSSIIVNVPQQTPAPVAIAYPSQPAPPVTAYYGQPPPAQQQLYPVTAGYPAAAAQYPSQYPQAQLVQPNLPQPGYPQPGYPQPGYPQPSYPQPGAAPPPQYQQPQQLAAASVTAVMSGLNISEQGQV